MKNHLKHMAIGGGLILAALLLFKVDLGTALPYALLLACPLGMMFMMFGMKQGHGSDGHGARGHDHSTPAEPAHDGAPHGNEPLTRDSHERIV